MEKLEICSKQLDQDDLKGMHSQMGLDGRFKGLSSDKLGLMQGNWSYQSASDGLSMHCGDVREMQNFSISTELPAGLSFNLIFNGKVSFALAGNQYSLGDNLQAVECSSFVLTHPEIMTRHVHKGMQVRKLNIFAEREWLASRCQTLKEREQLMNLFKHHAQVSYWKASPEIMKMATHLIELEQKQGIAWRLHIESRMIRLLSLYIDQLMLLGQESILQGVKTTVRPGLNHQCKLLIDEKEGENFSLEEIASMLNVSISTLQRRFKASFGMTVIEYTRQKRLEKAKVALVKDDLSIGEAAYLAGYNHPSNFVSAFKKLFALSPSTYKKNHHQVHRCG